jgi:D-arabinitol dehydrogenase (NADP+)
MKAIVYSEPKVFAYTDVPDPNVRADEVLIRVKACGLCRTDMHIHEGHFISTFPLTNGHEFAGEIAEVGADVSAFKVGDRVVADNTELCGHCFYCRRDEPLYCENFVSHGCNCAGGFAEYVAVKAEKTFPIQGLSWREAIMAEPTACAVHGLDVIALKPGSDVLMFGAGPTGLILAQLLKANGAARLVVAAPPGPKLELAAALAADQVVPVCRDDHGLHRAAIHNIFPNGFDTIVEATGAPGMFQDCLNYTRKGSQVIAYGVYPPDATTQVNPYDIFAQELVIKGSFAQTHCFDRAVTYLETGVVRVADMVTHEVPLAEYGRALEMMKNREGIKIAVCP